MAMRRLAVASLCMFFGAPVLAAGDAVQWYLNTGVGGVTPDKPWGGAGSAALYELDFGVHLSPAWSAELALNGAALDDRFGPGDIGLYGAALDALRVFNRAGAFAPYVSLGAGATHVAPPSEAGPGTRTEFMVQPGVGALTRLWQSADGSWSLALRPDVKARWTHGWAHAPGNPVDVLYVLGLTVSFGPRRTAHP